MRNNEKKRDIWLVQLLTAICESVSSWILRQELSGPPCGSWMFMTGHSVGWEEAIMYEAMARLKQVQDREA